MKLGRAIFQRKPHEEKENEINKFVISQIENRQIEGQEPDTYVKKFGFEDLDISTNE